MKHEFEFQLGSFITRQSRPNGGVFALCSPLRPLQLASGCRPARDAREAARPDRLGSARLGSAKRVRMAVDRLAALRATKRDWTGLDWTGWDPIGLDLRAEGCELRAKSRELREASNGQQRAAGAC